MAPKCQRLIVVGSPNSSNSKRLVEVAERAGCPRAMLVQNASEIPWAEFDGVVSVGITAGASAPEVLVDEIVAAFSARFDATIEGVTTARESIAFNLPRELRSRNRQTVRREPQHGLAIWRFHDLATYFFQ